MVIHSIFGKQERVINPEIKGMGRDFQQYGLKIDDPNGLVVIMKPTRLCDRLNPRCKVTTDFKLKQIFLKKVASYILVIGP